MTPKRLKKRTKTNKKPSLCVCIGLILSLLVYIIVLAYTTLYIGLDLTPLAIPYTPVALIVLLGHLLVLTGRYTPRWLVVTTVTVNTVIIAALATMWATLYSWASGQPLNDLLILAVTVLSALGLIVVIRSRYK